MTKRILLRLLSPLGLVATALAVPLASAGDDPPAATKAAAPATASAAGGPAVTDEEAAEDDILLVLGLPLAAADAREAGVDAVEVGAAIDATIAAGGSPAEVTPALVAEAEAARTRGPKKGFGVWVGKQLADGKRGAELALLIQKKKAEYAEMTAEQKAEVDAKLAALHDEWLAKRKAIHMRRKEMIAAGKKLHRLGEAELKALSRAQATNDRRRKRLEDAIAADPSLKGELDELMKRLERREDRLEEIEDRVEDRQEKLEDAAEKHEDRKDVREDRRDAREDRRDAREDRRDAREDRKDDRGGHGGKKKSEGKGG